MDERTPLTEEMFVEPTQPRRAPLTEKHFEGGVEFAPPAPPPSPLPRGLTKAQDVARTAISQGALGLAADVPGTPGTLSQLADLATEKAYKYGLLKPAEWLGLMPEGKTAEDFIRASKALNLPPQYKAEREGKVASAFGVPLPTPAGLESGITKLLPGFAERGYTPEAQAVGKATRLGTSMMAGPGGLGAAAGRFGAGAAGSTAGQLAERAATSGEFLSPEYREYIEPTATIAGTLAALRTGKGLTGFAEKALIPGGAARAGERDLVNLMREDVRAGRASQDMMDTALATGTPASVADIFGPKTKTGEYLARQAGLSTGPTREAAEAYAAIGKEAGTGVGERVPESIGRVRANLEQIVGAPIDAPGLEEVTRQANKATRRNVYSVANTNPNAQSIDLRGLGLVEGTNTPLVLHPMMQRAMVDAQKTAASAPAAWGIVPPEFSQTGQLTRSGNIAYWDQVKKELDREIKVAGNPNTGSYDPTRAASLQAVRTQLVDRLDQMVPEYATARNRALETFRAETAPEAGMEFYRTADAFKRQEAINALNQLTPEAQDMFVHGWVHGLSNEISKSASGLNTVANKLTMPGNFQDNARMMLGDNFDYVRGKILSENLRNNAGKLAIQEPKRGLLPTVGISGLEGGIAAALVDAFMTAQMTIPEHIPAALVGAGATAVTSAARQMAALRVANNVVPLMLSENPRDLARLSAMIDESPELGSIISSANAIVQGSQQPRTGRATGGGVNRAMTAERLIGLLESAHKSNQNKTESILEQPDEHVVKALKVANEHI
jgi:hypothetical protein